MLQRLSGQTPSTDISIVCDYFRSSANWFGNKPFGIGFYQSFHSSVSVIWGLLDVMTKSASPSYDPGRTCFALFLLEEIMRPCP